MHLEFLTEWVPEKTVRHVGEPHGKRRRRGRSAARSPFSGTFGLTVRESLFGKPRLLDCIQVEVTSVCPGRCVYCPHTTQAGYWRSRHMEAATFARLWPLMQESGRVHLQGWGEPFLHPRFMDFAALARKAGCRVSTTTCGLRMDETLAGQIVGSGIDIVAFSLVGTDEASNAPRAGVPFSRVCEAVRTLQRVRKAKMGVHLELHFAYLMLASQMEAVEGLPDLMDELDVHAAVISTLDYIAAPGLEAEAFSPHEAGKLDAARDILERVAGETAKRGRGLYYSLPSPRPDDGCGLFPCRGKRSPDALRGCGLGVCPPAST